MNRKTTYTRCLTLRLDPKIDELLTDACWSRRTSKAAWIRAAIRQSLGFENDRNRRRTGTQEL